MPVTEGSEQKLFAITTQFSEQLNWSWDERQSAVLSEFSWEKKNDVVERLHHLFANEWHKKNAKRLPAEIKAELGNLSVITKKQLIFTTPATQDCPTLVALLWPWEHGSTYSLRIKTLAATYNPDSINTQAPSALQKILSIFK